MAGTETRIYEAYDDSYVSVVEFSGATWLEVSNRDLDYTDINLTPTAARTIAMALLRWADGRAPTVGETVGTPSPDDDES